MKQKDIYDEIAEAVCSKMGDNFIVELHDVVKENDNVQHGLVIRDNAKSVAPALKLSSSANQTLICLSPTRNDILNVYHFGVKFGKIINGTILIEKYI